MKTISIKNKKYTLKYTLRAFFLFETITNYPFKFGKMLDEYILLYSMLLANNESFDVPFGEFIEACEADPTIFAGFTNFVLKEIEMQMQAAALSDKGVKKKTKKE